MDLNGYGCTVTWDGTTLTMDGTNRATRLALGAQDGPVVLEAAQVAGVDHKDATRLANGRVTVTDVSGARHVLHFRRKDSQSFSELAVRVQEAAQGIHPQL